MSLMNIEKLNVYYGDVHIVWDVTFSVKEGDIVSIIGANGAGKSTMLKTISGLLRPTSGEIHFRDKTIHSLKTSAIVELGVVLIPEGRLIFPQMSVLENLEMGSYIRKAKEKRTESLNRVFDLFPILSERRHQLAGTLSGGEQQMLAIGRGLMSLPQMLMLDEISLGLAPNIVSKLFQTVTEINRGGTTILLVEQNVLHALKISHRGYVLENGRLVISGTGRELLEDPHTKRAYLGI